MRMGARDKNIILDCTRIKMIFGIRFVILLNATY